MQLASNATRTRAALTPAQCRNGLYNTMVDHLGVQWAKVHVLAPYGGLRSIPDADLPAVLAKAVEDAEKMGAPKRSRPIRLPQRTALPAWPRAMAANHAAEYVGLSVSSLHRLRAAGDFPRPVQLTAGRNGWLREHLDGWLDARAGKGARQSTGDILADLPNA